VSERVSANPDITVTPSALKPRSGRRSVATSVQRNTDQGPEDLVSTTWFEQGLSGALFADGALQAGGPSLASLEADYGGLANPFPVLDESGAAMNFGDWDTSTQPASLASQASSLANTASLPHASSTTDGPEDDEDIDMDKHSTGAMSSQLASLSQRTTQAVRRLKRPGPGRMPLTVSSQEVNVALEGTNTLTSIINSITASDRDDVLLDPTTTNYGLTFSALASHQHLVALFRAICDAINICLQSKREHKQQHYRRHPSNGGLTCDVGPSSVAQFVMVLQLLMHLINRMDRSLFKNNPSIRRSSMSSGGYITPVTPGMSSPFTIDPLQTELLSRTSSPQCGLLVLVQDVVGIIHNEHEKLRHSIQQLQTDMEHPELH
jgi:hypothetical protein